MCSRCAKDSKFETQVYYTEETDRWLLIDYDDDPSDTEWVMTRRLGDEEIAIARYYGQDFVGVVVFLIDYWDAYSPRDDMRPAGK
jgi:hypothetical protein